MTIHMDRWKVRKSTKTTKGLEELRSDDCPVRHILLTFHLATSGLSAGARMQCQVKKSTVQTMFDRHHWICGIKGIQAPFSSYHDWIERLERGIAMNEECYSK
jgi:hypothetical protein